MLKLGGELFERQSGFLNHTLQRAGFERLVLGNNNCPPGFAHDEMRSGLANLHEAKAFQGACCRDATDIARNFHATASTGSCEKCRRMRFGRLF